MSACVNVRDAEGTFLYPSFIETRRARAEIIYLEMLIGLLYIIMGLLYLRSS